jgi:serine/threonine-protein kinase RsbW
MAGVASLADFSYDDIEDLRIAVDEACAHLLGVRPPAGTLWLRISPSDAGVEVVASSDALPGAGWPPAGGYQTLTWHVLAALADETGFDTDDHGPAIRFSKRRLPV